jgi:ribosomal protein L37AE/L43A
VCEQPSRIETPGSSQWQCPHCDHLLPVAANPSLPTCTICGGTELYKKKDFPHSLGMAILVVACLASTLTYWLREMGLTWTILLGSAAFDGLLYLWVKDVIVCYRCQAHFRGVAANPEHKPFELTIHERYRQERLRREQLKG